MKRCKTGFIAIAVAILTALGMPPAPALAGTVVEYHHQGLDAYFITGRANEQAALDASADFRRTGMTFQATAAASASPSISRICRFYISLVTPFVSSHFYGREGAECEGIRAQNLFGFTWEGYDFAVPEAVNGVCPVGHTQLFRGFRAAANGKTPNHRYSTSQAACTAMETQGYKCEERVFCGGGVTPVTPTASGALPRAYQGTFRGGQQDIAFSGTVTFNRQVGELGPNGEPIYRIATASANLSAPVPECSTPGAVALDTASGFLAVTLAGSGQVRYGGLFQSVPVEITCPNPPGPPAVIPFGYLWTTCLSEDNVLQNQTSSVNRLQGSCNANDGASFSWDFIAIP